jgi:hypothetical protein
VPEMKLSESKGLWGAVPEMKLSESKGLDAP